MNTPLRFAEGMTSIHTLNTKNLKSMKTGTDKSNNSKVTFAL